jgi:hypothetical protein
VQNDVNRTVRLSQATLAAADDSPWIYWEDLSLKFAGASLKLGVRLDKIFGEIATSGEYRHGQLGVVLGNVDFDKVRLFRQPFQTVHAQLLMDPARAPGWLQARNLRADLFGGSVIGEGSIMLESPSHFRLDLKAVQLRLEEIARHNRLGPDAQLSGQAMAMLYLEGQGSDLSTLQGGGTIDVQGGRIYNLPPLLDLLKFLKLRAPDGTAFEEAHASFKVRGDQAHFDEFDLIGNLVSLTGEGDVKLDGRDLHLDVYPIWTRVVQALPRPARDAASVVSKGLYKVEMRGNLGGAIDYRQEAMPVIIEPVRRLLERLQRTSVGR